MKKIMSILFIIVPSLIFGYLGKPVEMGLAIVAGAIAASFLHIDQISKFKGAGFEAEMKKVVEEGYATIENLRQISIPLLKSISLMLTQYGRWGGIDNDEKHKLHKEIERISKDLDINNKELNNSFKLFYNYHSWDCFDNIINSLH